MPDEARPVVPVKQPYPHIGKAEAAERDCSKTCANYVRGCAVCDGSIMYAEAPEE